MELFLSYLWAQLGCPISFSYFILLRKAMNGEVTEDEFVSRSVLTLHYLYTYNSESIWYLIAEFLHMNLYNSRLLLDIDGSHH